MEAGDNRKRAALLDPFPLIWKSLNQECRGAGLVGEPSWKGAFFVRLADEMRHEAIRRYVNAAADVRGREGASGKRERGREGETREARCERERGGILSVGVMCPGAGCSLERGRGELQPEIQSDGGRR